MPDEISRREFATACAALAASFSACSGLTQRTQIAAAFVVDPVIDDYRAELEALIRTVLPIGSPDFPLGLAAVESRLLRMFPLEDERRFLGFQRTLSYFASLDLAPHVAAPLLAAERIAYDVPLRTPEAEFRRICAAKMTAESTAFAAFSARSGNVTRFSMLDEPARTEWLRLWRASEFTVKRDFAGSARLMISSSAYSSDRMWPAIGYEGPLVEGPERGR